MSRLSKWFIAIGIVSTGVGLLLYGVVAPRHAAHTASLVGAWVSPYGGRLLTTQTYEERSGAYENVYQVTSNELEPTPDEPEPSTIHGEASRAGIVARAESKPCLDDSPTQTDAGHAPTHDDGTPHGELDFATVTARPLSTVSIDVDTASYSNATATTPTSTASPKPTRCWCASWVQRCSPSQRT